MEIKFKLLNQETCHVETYHVKTEPTKGTKLSAGYDLYSAQNILLKSNCTELVPVGISIEIPNNYFGMICSRSGLATKGIFILNAPGIIDSDYRGEIKCILHNISNTNFQIEIGMKIAQLIIRDQNGFGSTGL